MYPVMINLDQLAVLVIGGGKIATRKVRGLLEAGGHVTVIAPTSTADIQQWQQEHQLTLKSRPFMPGDTEGFDLIFICTDQTEVNAAVHQEIKETQWVNDATCHEKSRFYNMGVIREKNYLVATSAYGKNPCLAKRLCQFIKKSLIKFD